MTEVYRLTRQLMYPEPVNMRIMVLMMLIVFSLSTVTLVFASEEKAKQTLTIESKISGSQEQPKVLYIMPWQGITDPITVTDSGMQLTLPTFRPINPKVFKKEVRDFVENQTQVHKAQITK
jgi:hypothetical protein